jgi:hypothetical protein
MEAMLGISLYSYPYLTQQKRFVFLIIVYVFFSTKLEKRADQVLPGSDGAGGWGGAGRRGRGQRAGGEMAQTMHEHVNKLIKNLKK